MRFSLRRSSPMRTAIYSFNSVRLMARGFGASGSLAKALSPEPEALKRHSRAETPAALGVRTAAHPLAFDIQPVADADAGARRRGALFRAHPVESRAAANPDPLAPQPLLGADRNHPAIARRGRVGLHVRVDRQHQ